MRRIHAAQGELQQAVLDHVFAMRPILTAPQYERLIQLTADALRRCSPARGVTAEHRRMATHDPDLPLVRALQGGDDAALDSLMEKYGEPLFRFISRFTRDHETARDLHQETFVRAYFGIHRFKPRNKFNTWLYLIATNLCRDRARSKQHRQDGATDSLDDPDFTHAPASTSEAPDADAERNERLQALESAIAELPHDLRAALVLFALAGHSYDECAELLGITAKAVESRLYRARKLLTKKLSPP